MTHNLSLEENAGAWNRRAGLLFIDQPVGTGFSVSGVPPVRVWSFSVCLSAKIFSYLEGEGGSGQGRECKRTLSIICGDWEVQDKKLSDPSCHWGNARNV